MPESKSQGKTDDDVESKSTTTSLYDHTIWYTRAKQEVSSSLQLAHSLKLEGNTSLVALQRSIEKKDAAAIEKHGSAALHHYENGLRVVSRLYRDLVIIIDKVEGKGEEAMVGGGDDDDGGSSSSIRSLIRGGSSTGTTTTTTVVSSDIVLHLATLASNYLQCIITISGVVAVGGGIDILTGVFGGHANTYIEAAARRVHRVLLICEPVCLRDFSGGSSISPTLGIIVGKLVLRLARVYGSCCMATLEGKEGATNFSASRSGGEHKARTIEDSESSSATTSSKALALYRKLLPAHSPSIAPILLPSSQTERDSTINVLESEIKAVLSMRDRSENKYLPGLRGKF